jgi:hypothetical protein
VKTDPTTNATARGGDTEQEERDREDQGRDGDARCTLGHLVGRGVGRSAHQLRRLRLREQGGLVLRGGQRHKVGAVPALEPLGPGGAERRARALDDHFLLPVHLRLALGVDGELGLERQHLEQLCAVVLVGELAGDEFGQIAVAELIRDRQQLRRLPGPGRRLVCAERGEHGDQAEKDRGDDLEEVPPVAHHQYATTQSRRPPTKAAAPRVRIA